MGIRNFPVIAMEAGKRITIGTATFTTMPILDGGEQPKYVFVKVTPGTAAGNVIFVNPAQSAVAGSTTTGLPIWADRNEGFILNVHGYSHMSLARTGDNTSNVYFIPLTDF